MHHPDFNLKRAPSVDQTQFLYLSMPLKNKFSIFIAGLLLLMSGNRGEAGASATTGDYSISEDSVLNVVNAEDGLLKNDSTDGSSLKVIGIDTASLSTKGAVTFNSDGTFTYDPTGVATFQALNKSQTASDSFKYTVQDSGGDSDTATVTITIQGANDAPVANLDKDVGFFTNEDFKLTTGNVLTNDTDVDSSELTVTGLDDSATDGLVTSNGDGTFAYDPNGQFEALGISESSADVFTYTVSDGDGGSASATVSIIINGNNDAPIAREDIGFGFETDEDTSIITGNILSNDNDPDTNDTLTLSVGDLSGVGGLLINNTNGTFIYNPNGQFEHLSVGETSQQTFKYTI